MTAHIATDGRSNLIGSAWMVAAMAGFAVEDAFIKLASQSLPVAQILVMFGLGGALVFALLARRRGERLLSADVLSRPMKIRAGFEIGGRLFYTLAIALTPLSSTTVILQATPLVVVAGAALVFGERVGWRRWTAIVVGLIGVLIILQPGADSFSVLSLLAVFGMLGFAGRDLASRAAPAALSARVLGVYGFLSIVIAGVLYAPIEGQPFRWPEGVAVLALAGATLAGVAAYQSLMTAMRTGEVSAVTPFRYTRLLFGVGLGLVVFGETLTPATLLGSGLIVLSGLFILWRGQGVTGRR
ncbi:DMT family transporter [Aestuariivita boseongensis]|uniref:DMT family transporter n=1 Tax=Aestuariivita boseongensis TaxID=1470562 RepID=UPI000681FEA5|nr:DMT family transporter [Aestuariivita boseongensis]